MADIKSMQAAAAYRDATRVAEKILTETTEGTATPIQTGQPMKPSFPDLLGHSLQSARDVGYKGEAQSTRSVANESELHDLINAVSNAELTLNTVVAVRDRVISAYQDIIKMPI